MQPNALKIAIASNIVLDTIQTPDGKIVQSAGGPACYCGLTSRRFGFNVKLVSKVGNDFPQELFAIFQNNDIILSHNSKVDAPTTKFRISSQGNSRHLSLIDKCEPITVQDIQNTKVDCWLASPVMDELPLDTLTAIKQKRCSAGCRVVSANALYGACGSFVPASRHRTGR